MINYSTFSTYCLQRNFTIAVSFTVLMMLAAKDLAAAPKWKNLSQAEAVIKLKNLPNAERCSFRTKQASNYSKQITVGYCPAKPGKDEPRTYIRVLELMPGYYWGRTYSEDFSEHPIFIKVWKKISWFKYFKNPKIASGQRTTCISDDVCRQRRVEFSVSGQQCQWILNTPDLGQPRSAAPYGVELFTCQLKDKMTASDISMKPGKVTFTFPGGKKDSEPANKREAIGIAPKLTKKASEKEADSGTEPSLEGRITDQLKALKRLEDAGLISKGEAAAKRKKILKNL
jgi:hypothetical protein